MEFSRVKYLHIRQRANMILIFTLPSPPILSSSLHCFSSSNITEVKKMKSLDGDNIFLN